MKRRVLGFFWNRRLYNASSSPFRLFTRPVRDLLQPEGLSGSSLSTQQFVSSPTYSVSTLLYLLPVICYSVEEFSLLRFLSAFFLLSLVL